MPVLSPRLLAALALLLAAPALRAQTPCPTSCDAFVAPADLSRFNQSTAITAAVYVDDARDDGNRRTDPQARLAGCVGGELRGVIGAQQVQGASLYSLSVAGAPNETGADIALVYCSAQDGDRVAAVTPSANFDNTPTFEVSAQYGSPSIPYRVQAPAALLPVELTGFFARADGADSAVLTWQTASETSNAGFWVEHERAHGWADAAFVAGAGTTLEPRRYVHRIANLAPGTHRFRLRQVDLDGAAAHGPVAEVAVRARPALALLSARPDQAGGALGVRFTVARSGHARVSVFDLLGRRAGVVFGGYAEAGREHEARRALELAPGVYVVTLESGGERRSRSVVVAR